MVFSKSILRQLLLLTGLVALTASAVVPRARPSRGFVARRLTLPEGVPEDCTFLDTPATEGDDCQALADIWGISTEDFIAWLASWNPAVGSKCIGLWADSYVCIGVIGQTTPTQPGNGIETPSPIQIGMIKSCKKFHLVKTTTTCTSIQDYFKITIAQLAKWNTAIGSKCTGL
ncbi:uncharacterized protein AUP68_09229 [Ilyonectria robusta]